MAVLSLGTTGLEGKGNSSNAIKKQRERGYESRECIGWEDRVERSEESVETRESGRQQQKMVEKTVERSGETVEPR